LKGIESGTCYGINIWATACTCFHFSKWFRKKNNWTLLVVKMVWRYKVMFGLGKPRSKLGRFLDMKKITQDELSKKSGVSKSTISKLCTVDTQSPRLDNAKRIIKALRELSGRNVDFDDFWSV
jgi:transcriptional regulator with XRE-family HTH domain